jgi:hypothetical protein
VSDQAVEPPADEPAVDAPADPKPSPAVARPSVADAGPDDTSGDQLTLDDMSAGAVPPTRKRRERKRPSVPSWDEIVFGGGGSGKPDG